MTLVGVSFKARSENQGLELFLKLGNSHEVQFTTLPAVSVPCFKPNIIICTGNTVLTRTGTQGAPV